MERFKALPNVTTALPVVACSHSLPRHVVDSCDPHFPGAESKATGSYVRQWRSWDANLAS